MGYDGFSPVHLHLVSTKKSCFDALVVQVELEGFVVEGNVSDWLDCKEILKKTVEVARIADILQSNRKVVVHWAV